MAYYGRASLNRGDYYRGDYYRGDPGFFGSLIHGIGGVIGGAVKGFIGGGPLGAIKGAVGGAVSATRTNMAGEVSSAPVNVHAQQVALHQQALAKLAARGGAGAAGAIGAGGRKRRSMNAGNAHALRRALRRAEAFKKLASRALRLTHPHLHVAGFKVKGARGGTRRKVA